MAALASLAGAPAALAGPLPPPGGPVTDPVPPPPPPAPAAAHLPLWAVVTIVAATVVLSVATTLITLVAGTPAPGAPPQPAPADMQSPSATAEPPAGQGDILSSHQHPAGHDMHRADSR